ncbi:hypothetical protein CYMTET_51490 [Cymbomonas tetramitiformis]|uniref:Uncharacterized protein n=1 Tax=Cymbomonas tetramitiformis TaxID=36881 RepID=A0AAE0BM67_9CHLO|nr:hypothetical protein CYMTET_51490 [Cymbomonas tetramitiformis]
MLRELVGKASARIEDILWGKLFPQPVPLARLSLFRARGTSSVSKLEELLAADKPKLDTAYAAQDRRLQELKEDLASRPDAPVCTVCKKKVDRFHAKKMCKPCYTKHTYTRSKTKKRDAEGEQAVAPRPRGRPRKS